MAGAEIAGKILPAKWSWSCESREGREENRRKKFLPSPPSRSSREKSYHGEMEKRAGVHTVNFCRRPVKPSFNRKNGAPVLAGNKNVAHPVPPASGF
jgi:hypothetical protein